MQDVSRMTAQQLLEEFSHDSECSTERGLQVYEEILNRMIVAAPPSEPSREKCDVSSWGASGAIIVLPTGGNQPREGSERE